MNPKKMVSLMLSLSLLMSLLTFTPVNVSANTSGTVFLMGGAISDDNSEIYNALYQAAEGTGSPVVAVFCSAASDLAAAEDAYYNDIPGHLSYKNLFRCLQNATARINTGLFLNILYITPLRNAVKLSCKK